MKKKLVVLTLATSMVMSMALTGCGSEKAGSASNAEKPEKITLMVNGTFYTKENGQAEWEAKFEELTGIDLEIIQPDHSTYDESVTNTIASGEWPDVVLLSSSYYASYAAEGVLYDMSDLWEASEAKKQMSASDQGVMDSLYVGDALYGFTLGRGGGCCTYIKKKWLDNVGLGVPTNYEEYIKVCDAFRNGDPDGNGVKGDTYAVSAAGLIGPESPWMNYFPEFYQDAYPSFYQNDKGEWVDGFTEPAMKDALARLKDAYAKGYIDPTTLTNTTKDVRTLFYEDKTGIFTYWAGKWANNLKTNLEANGLDSELVALEPIAEVGTYVERVTGAYSITSKCENPEGVFKYFIEPIFLDGDYQVLWRFGVEDVHWSMKEEEILGVKYPAGVVHGCLNLENPETVYTWDANDARVGMSEAMKAKYPMDTPQVQIDSQKMFNENCRAEIRVPSTEEFATYMGDVVKERASLIADVVVNGKDIDTAMNDFINGTGGKYSKMIVESLNK